MAAFDSRDASAGSSGKWTGKMVMTSAAPDVTEITLASSKGGRRGVAVPPSQSTNPPGKDLPTGAIVTSNLGPYWKVASTQEFAQPVAIDYSLAFHCLQEARRELHQARSGLPNLSVGERARLVAYYEGNLARAALWVARASGADVIAPTPLPHAP
jgi:hypothetical protein